MASGSFRFDRFRLDPADRRLRRDGMPVELNARYLDALALLVREQGQLVSKDRFFEEVWRGVPVTDDALTQCIATLRRQLGDSAGNPRFIETVPKHGYRFIAAVTADDEPGAPAPDIALKRPRHHLLITTAAGTAAGGAAGFVGGLIYGLAGASAPGVGAISVMLVLACLTLLIGLLGGAGVAFGVALATAAARPHWLSFVISGAIGGMIVGAFVKLLGLDMFNLLFGRSPGDITGAAEGALLGAAIGLGAWVAGRRTGNLRHGLLAGGVAGGLAGVLIPWFGGRLMGGSLDLLSRSFPDSQLRLGQMGALVGEGGFGPVSQMVTGGLEGALFGACVVGAMAAAQRRLTPESYPRT